MDFPSNAISIFSSSGGTLNPSDGVLHVPAQVNNCMEIPRPLLPIGDLSPQFNNTVYNDSFFISMQEESNNVANATRQLFVLGPGLWRLQLNWIQWNDFAVAVAIASTIQLTLSSGGNSGYISRQFKGQTQVVGARDLILPVKPGDAASLGYFIQTTAVAEHCVVLIFANCLKLS